VTVVVVLEVEVLVLATLLEVGRSVDEYETDEEVAADGVAAVDVDISAKFVVTVVTIIIHVKLRCENTGEHIRNIAEPTTGHAAQKLARCRYCAVTQFPYSPHSLFDESVGYWTVYR